ncbi:MAG: hypothetical protein MPW15_27900 [Candidatus Manganitrophus sp.]|nr:hypothetical protein [Candidatus Manganitrophus sp.]
MEKNIYVFSPVMIPFYHSMVLRKANQLLLAAMIRRQLKRLGFSKPITWTFAPSSADVVGWLGESQVIYHCVDEFSAFSDAPQTAIQKMEETLLKKSDVVIVSASTLQESKRRWNPNTHLVRHGVEYDHFRKALDPATAIPPELAALPRPIIGFHGLVADWIDLPLIRKMAIQYPKWSIVLLGSATTDVSQISGLKNVHLLGKRPYESLPSYCKGFDAAILPFVVNRLDPLCESSQASGIPGGRSSGGLDRSSGGAEPRGRHPDRPKPLQFHRAGRRSRSERRDGSFSCAFQEHGAGELGSQGGASLDADREGGFIPGREIVPAWRQ